MEIATSKNLYNNQMIPWLEPSDPFPPLSRALAEPNGLLAAGGELSAKHLIRAYRRGIFPWYSEGEPLLWWSPDPRMVLFPAELKISRSLRKRLKRRDYQVRVDTSFETVMRACAEPRDGQRGTWITEEMIRAYCDLHALGYAHSVETWIDGQLAGGLYGIAIGRMFYGESMFMRVADASKIATAHLAHQLGRWQFGMIDCQMKTAHLASLGAREISRTEFIAILGNLVDLESPPQWQFDDDLFE